MLAKMATSIKDDCEVEEDILLSLILKLLKGFELWFKAN